MRTNIDIDDQLMAQAMKASGATTKKAAVDEALRMMVRIKGQGAIRKLFGKVQWEGDLEWSRSKNKWEEAEKRDAVQKKSDAGARPRRKAA